MNTNTNPSYTKADNKQTIAQFANELVNNWTEQCGIVLRPSEKQLLRDMLTRSVPQFLSINSSLALEAQARAIRNQQKLACIQAIEGVPEVFNGTVSKQRVINACTYANPEPEYPAVEEQPENDDKRNLAA